MQSTLEVLTWALENVHIVEITCDMVCADPGEVNIPTLPAPEREMESRLLGCLECRPGGLNPGTPMRDREWLWRGLNGMIDVAPSATNVALQRYDSEPAEGG